MKLLGCSLPLLAGPYSTSTRLDLVKKSFYLKNVPAHSAELDSLVCSRCQLTHASLLLQLDSDKGASALSSPTSFVSPRSCLQPSSQPYAHVACHRVGSRDVHELKLITNVC